VRLFFTDKAALASTALYSSTLGCDNLVSSSTMLEIISSRVGHSNLEKISCRGGQILGSTHQEKDCSPMIGTMYDEWPYPFGQQAHG